jgi:hypothetical protein
VPGKSFFLKLFHLLPCPINPERTQLHFKNNQVKNYLIKIISSGLIAFALALSPATIRAQDPTNTPTETAPATPEKHGGLPFHGKVSAVDTGAETVTVGNLTLNITSSTKITNATNGVPAILSDITVGESVSGSYLRDDNGQFCAKSIHIGTKAHKTKKKKKAISADGSAATNSVPYK